MLIENSPLTRDTLAWIQTNMNATADYARLVKLGVGADAAHRLTHGVAAKIRNLLALYRDCKYPLRKKEEGLSEAFDIYLRDKLAQYERSAQSNAAQANASLPA